MKMNELIGKSQGRIFYPPKPGDDDEYYNGAQAIYLAVGMAFEVVLELTIAGSFSLPSKTFFSIQSSPSWVV